MVTQAAGFMLRPAFSRALPSLPWLAWGSREQECQNSLDTTLHCCWDALLPSWAFFGRENCMRLFVAGLLLFTELWVCRWPWPGTTWWQINPRSIALKWV